MKKMNKSQKSIELDPDGKNGSREWKPYIEFGAQKGDSSERKVGKHVNGHDAYDLWHLAVRYKEVLACRNLIRNDKLKFEDIPRKHKFLIFFLILAECHEVKEVVELGCSVLELIDGLELVQKYFQKTHNCNLDFDINKYKFIGIDTSDLMCQAAGDIHKENNVELFKDTSLFLKSAKSSKDTPRALFDLNVSSYAFKSSSDLAVFFNEFDMGYIELALSTAETFISSQYHGKPFTYFSLKELRELLNKPLYFLCEKKTDNVQWYFNRQGKPVVNGFFIFGEPDRVNSFFDNAKTHSEVAQYFIERGVDLIEVTDLLK